MWDLVGNSEDRFSHNEAYVICYSIYFSAEIRCQRKENQAETFMSVIFDELANAFKDYVDIHTANTGVKILEENNKQGNFKSQVFYDSGEALLGLKRKSFRQKENISDVSLLSQELSDKMNNFCGKHSMQASQDSDDQNFVNHSRKAFSDPDEKTESPIEIESTFCDASPTQPLDCDNCSYYIDDCATKLAVWKKALDTVFVILGIDSFIQTGLTDESSDRKLCHSAL